MATDADSRSSAAVQRDESAERLRSALEAGEFDGASLRDVCRFTLDAARWASAADSTDAEIVGLLRETGQIVLAMSIAATAPDARRVHFCGAPRIVNPKPDGPGMTADEWSDGLWAATAAGDAGTAVQLSRSKPPIDASTRAPGSVALSSALASWWIDDPIGPSLIAALTQSDPRDADTYRRDHALDIITPAVAVMRYLAGGQDELFFESFAAARQSFRKFWSDPARTADPRGFLSLPLTGVAVIARSFGLSVRSENRVIPEAMVALSDLVVCCPVCNQPFTQEQSTCAWCAADLAVDAPVESTMARYLATPSGDCPRCHRRCRVDALYCWNCRQQLDLSAPGTGTEA